MDHIIYRDYITNRCSFIYCSPATSDSLTLLYLAGNVFNPGNNYAVDGCYLCQTDGSGGGKDGEGGMSCVSTSTPLMMTSDQLVTLKTWDCPVSPLIFNAHSTVKVITGREKTHPITVSARVAVHVTRPFMFKRTDR